MRTFVRLWPTWRWPVCLILALAGCLPELSEQQNDNETSYGDAEQVLPAGPPRVEAGSRFTEVESNDDFASADRIEIGTQIELVGSIAGGSGVLDRDCYELGPASTGDRLRAQLNLDVSADVVLGVFDDSERLLGFADLSSSTSGPTIIDIVFRERTSLLYVVPATRYGLSSDVSYSVNVTLERGASSVTYQPQVVVLDFDGGTQVGIGRRPPVDVPPFDAATIEARFAGDTETIVTRVLSLVQEDYNGLNVEIYRSGDPGIPPGDHARIYFGTYDSRLLGLADNIDPFNTDLSQSAVVYTDTFALFSVFSPTVEQIAQVLANVTSHETGHLLGLRHTADPSSIMDVTASARQMMLDQWFTRAVLHESVMPMGYQDAPAMLAWTVGGALQPESAGKIVKRQRAIDAAGAPDDFYIPRWQLGTCLCPHCSAEHEETEEAANEAP